MNLKQLEYVVAIADYNNISKAADALFITQSGLNQQLIKLEQELGLQLFYRNKHSLHATEAGEIYLKGAREILKIKKNTYTKLDELRGNTIGEIKLGLTHEHGIDLFMSVFPQFNQRYPGITFNLTEAIVARQHALLLNGGLDFGIVMFDEKEKINLNYIRLYTEGLVLGVCRSHPLAKNAARPGEPLTTIDLKLFKDEPFSLIFANSTMRKVVKPQFDLAGFQPHLLIETAMNHAIIKMVGSGLCCTIIPQSRALASHNENVAWFYLESRPQWNVYLAYPKDTELSSAARYFIQLALIYGAEMERAFV